MNKVIIIGCPGAGKSTFARKLSEATGLPLFYLDHFWHKADKTNYTEDEFDLKLSEVLSKDEWIIDGNYLRTIDIRIENCDTVFFLDIPVEDCISGVEARIGKPREDMPWTETEFDPEFKQWIFDFEKDQLPKINSILKKYSGAKRIVKFKSRNEADNYLKNSFKLHNHEI